MALQKVETVLNQQKRGQSAQSSVLVSALQTALVPQSDSRTALVFCSHPTSALTVSIVQGAGSGAGITIPAAGLPVILTMAEHGSIVTYPWFVTGGTVPATFTYIEVQNTAP